MATKNDQVQVLDDNPGIGANKLDCGILTKINKQEGKPDNYTVEITHDKDCNPKTRITVIVNKIGPCTCS